jgi:hypothetical protein
VYALHDSFILDSASTIHVCNNCERFQSLRPATENDHLIAGASRIPIEGFGLVEITLKRSPTSTRKIKLAEVALVPSFHTNIVSLDRLMQRNVHWNTERQELRYNSSVDSDQSSTIEVIRRDDTVSKTQQAHAQHALPTPEDTPAPTQPEEVPPPSQVPSQARARQEIVGDVGESNIVEGTRTRKPSKRHLIPEKGALVIQS